MTDETPSENVMATVKAPMNILRKDPDESIEEAFRRELNEELTPERAMAFFEDGVISVRRAGHLETETGSDQ